MASTKVTGLMIDKGYSTTATAAGTTTLTVNSSYAQFFTGSTTQTVVLPVTSTLNLGQEFYIVNNSTGAVTVNSSGGNLVKVLAAGTTALITCILTSGTTAASWSCDYVPDQAGAGSTPIIARYKSAAGQSIPNNTYTIINFGTQDFDTYGLVTTGASWKFTATSARWFRVSSHVRFSTAMNAVNVAFKIFKNGSAGPALADYPTDNSSGGRGDLVGGTIIQLNATEYFDIRVVHNLGSSATLLPDADYVYVDISAI